MTEAITVAIITSLCTIAGTILTFIIQLKKLRTETEQRAIDAKQEQDARNAQILNGMNTELTKVKESVDKHAEAVTDLKASYQNSVAIIELRLEHMTEKFNDMQVEVREHNNFAKRLPVLEDRIKVANHRIEDLEQAKGTS